MYVWAILPYFHPCAMRVHTLYTLHFGSARVTCKIVGWQAHTLERPNLSCVSRGPCIWRPHYSRFYFLHLITFDKKKKRQRKGLWHTHLVGPSRPTYDTIDAKCIKCKVYIVGQIFRMMCPQAEHQDGTELLF